MFSSSILDLPRSSVGRKAIVAVTGALLYLFVIGHLAGNLQIFLGQNALNAYALKLRHLGGLLWPVRAGLAAVFVTHIVLALWLAADNRRARPVGYAKQATVRATWASLTMVPTGLAILFFVLFHLAHFTLFAVRPEYAHLHDALGRHDVYTMVVLSFRSPVMVSFYLAAMFFLLLHLSQAFSGMFQSWGLTDQSKLCCLKSLSAVLACLVFAGYAAIPLAVQLGWLALPPGVRP